MSVVIRMARAGTKKRPVYHIVVADSRFPRDGRFIERLGFFNPLLAKDHKDRLRLDLEKVKDRIIEFLGKHESFASLDEAALAIAEYLPSRTGPTNPQRLKRNLRERPDGRWEWKHRLGRVATTENRRVGWRQLTEGMDDEARNITCPVLVLRGAKSDVLSDEGANEIAALLPDARLATVSAAGHHAAGDNPETTTSLVREFLTEIGW